MNSLDFGECQILKEDKISFKILIALHLFLFLNSLLGTSSKFASQESFLSKRFLIFYAIALFNMGLYAIVWQQLIKRIQLTTAYSNKAICMIWTVLWGWLFFHEKISLWKIFGVCFIIAGIILVVTADEEKRD